MLSKIFKTEVAQVVQVDGLSQFLQDGAQEVQADVSFQNS